MTLLCFLLSLGIQAILDLDNCQCSRFDDIQWIEQQCRTSAVKAGGHIIRSDFHHFTPWGISGVVIISESHIAIHTWPEFKYAAVDIFTCSKDLGVRDAIDHFIKALRPEFVHCQIFERGKKKKINP